MLFPCPKSAVGCRYRCWHPRIVVEPVRKKVFFDKSSLFALIKKKILPMAPSKTKGPSSNKVQCNPSSRYSCLDEAKLQSENLLRDATLDFPATLKHHAQDVTFTSSLYAEFPLFLCPFKQTETIAILKGLEGSIVAAMADIRYGAEKRKIIVNLDKCARYLMSAYICTIDGLGKLDPKVKTKLKSKS
jgi:hypothetical protein